ncbi:MAG: hypothetical protein JNJ62_12285 [Pseudoxanthomonas mexicana]|nr:hypothetical protein [Pseudoxanthomonas mexicana]
MRQRIRRLVGRSALALFLGAGSAHAGDREDVLARITEYMAYEESGNLVAQGELMLDERSMVYPGGRSQGNNREGMAQQQAAQDAFAAEFPGVHYAFELRDVEVQVWNADSALAMFETVPTRIVPPSLPPEKVAKLGAPKIPLIVAVMLVKHQGAWKIAHTTFVPRDKD